MVRVSTADKSFDDMSHIPAEAQPQRAAALLNGDNFQPASDNEVFALAPDDQSTLRRWPFRNIVIR
jgi:hypothetical protein